ncbi:MAG: tRNA (adenosine(37)-N6)-dimethylallyltransferase MiaA [Alphaproteobacteria bacterium]|nr:tRNA (adenosine(37)-N6)-dimethylallyltransferase MiaA [Alphaproteobacteria bacterium]
MGEVVTVTLLLGPTASGKSARALELAAQRNGVIINADALQLYQDLPILTARPAASEQALAPHKLYGFLKAHETSSAALWRSWAMAEIERAHAAGQHPIVVGGTGFYFKALTEGLSPMPDVPDAIRSETITLQSALGNPAFHKALAQRDAVIAARLDPNDTQRLVRAWEVLAATGQSLAYWQSLPKDGPPPHWEFKTEIIMPPREELYQRCDARFLHMLEMGALDEVAQFKARIDAGGVAPDAPPTRALGYHTLAAYLAGALSLEDAVIQAQTQTRQYAKRQMTWIRTQVR